MLNSDFITIIILTHKVLFYGDVELECIAYDNNDENISVYIFLLDTTHTVNT